MKRFAALFLAVLVVFSMAACGSEPVSTVDPTDGMSVEECYLAIMDSKNAEEMSEYICVGKAEDYYSNVEKLFGGDTFTVSADYSGTYGGYEVYYLTIKSKTDKSKTMSNFEIFKKEGDDYKLALDAETISKINTECLCPTCKGVGSFTTGGNACGICGGTGVQYYPNAYFDAGTNMWMGETRACSGCAGAGHMGGTTTNCSTCHGRKYVFK
ncbi:MAG: hypothetical protein IJ426_03275 [Clostridia bacterium]|nr:hypothetical protein [Clostridia bacterium]